MTPNKLPPLPEPFGELERAGVWNGAPREGSDDVFTADQMHAYAAEALRQSQSLPAGAVAYTQPVYSLARKLLWLAYVWNDHNFDAAHVEAREEAQRFGIDSFDSANEWLEKQNALIDRTLQADAREKGGAWRKAPPMRGDIDLHEGIWIAWDNFTVDYTDTYGTIDWSGAVAWMPVNKPEHPKA